MPWPCDQGHRAVTLRAHRWQVRCENRATQTVWVKTAAQTYTNEPVWVSLDTPVCMCLLGQEVHV